MARTIPANDVAAGSDAGDHQLRASEQQLRASDGPANTNYDFATLMAQAATTGQTVAAVPQPQAEGLTVQKVETIDPAAVKEEIQAAPNKTVVLGENDRIDAILVNGDDLILRLADGSLIVIKGGLKDIPNIVIGHLEVPAPALKASLEAAGITLPAAGPEDADSHSSGGHFAVAPGSIGSPFAIRDLLHPTEFSRAYTDQHPHDVVAIANHGVDIGNLTPAVKGGDTSVREADLPNGSRGGEGPAQNGGDFTISVPDGGAGLTINGVSIITDGVLTGNTVTTPLGTLTITSYDPETGKINYSYEIDHAVTHPDGQGHNSIFDNFHLVLTDGDGDQTSGDLAVRIVDDVPKAVSESDFVKEDGALTADGNVLTGTGGTDANNKDGAKDVQGADGVTAVTWTGAEDGHVGGAHGTLTVGADGSYSYTLDNADKAVQGLGAGETLTETFTYTITDADGDSSTATLTITIRGTDDGVHITDLTPKSDGGDAAVLEANLPDGSSPDADGLTQGGSFTISAPDGLDLLKVGGVSIIENGVFTAHTFTTPLGNTLSITGFDPNTGTVTYTYTLADNEHHAAGGGANNLFEDFAVVLKDTDGSTANDTLSIRIVDDVPTAHSDTDAVTEDGPLTADGNVLTGSGGTDSNTTDGVKDVAGADGVSIAWAGAEGGHVGGAHGTLTVGADGSYSYLLDNTDKAVQGLAAGETLTETFTYTITDSDGDPSTATLTITINGQDDGVHITDLTPKSDGGDASVNEANLADGSSPDAGALTQGGTFTISAPDGVGLLQVGGVSIIENGVFTAHTFTTPLGNTLSITGYDANTGTVTYSYTLADNEAHPAGGGANSLFEDFAVLLKDTDGSTDTGTLSVRVVDDVPSAGEVTAGGDAAPGQFNLMLVFDNSSSMGRDPGVAGYATKLDVAKQAMIDAINEFDAKGDVKVRIVTFSSEAHEVGSQWMTVAEATAAITGITVFNGRTDFDAALRVAKGAFLDAGKITDPDAQNVSVFLSDGNPNQTDSHNDPTPTVGIDPSEEADWISYLSTHHIVSHAVGIGTDMTIGNLDPIAYNGSLGTNSDAIAVADLNDLSDVLSGLTDRVLAAGDVYTSATPEAHPGADGGALELLGTGAPAGFTYQLSGGQLLVKQGATTVITVSVNPETGAYEIAQKAAIAHGSSVTSQEFDFNYKVTDGDGDSATGKIAFTLSYEENSSASARAGGGLADHIYLGTHGDDVLAGSLGNDLLAGGKGADTISSGLGKDTIYFDSSAFDAKDHITDYVSGKDAIDLSDLFTVDTAGGQSLANYAQMSGHNLQVDANGAAGGEQWTTIATLNTSAPVSIIFDDNTHKGDQTGTA